MRVKTFRGKNTKAVLDQVKRELGAGAVILSTQSKRENGICFCEVMAAVEHETPGDGAGQSGPGGGASPDSDAREDVMSLKREWGQIKEVLLGLAGDRIDLESLTPLQQQGLRFLEEDGVHRQVVIRLFARLSRDRDCSLLKALSEVVPVRALTPAAFPHKVQAFSGPSGVGKTTQLIRMALAVQKASPKARICLVSADCERGKGRLLLKHYAQLSKMTFREIHGPDDAADVMAALHGFDRVFVDLPAVARGKRLGNVLRELGLAEIPSMDVHLLLSPHYAPAQIDSFLDTYRTAKTVSLIWTKLDEACTFGSIVNAAESCGLPTSALVGGPGLRDAVPLTEAMTLWKLLFKHELPKAAQDAPRQGHATGQAA